MSVTETTDEMDTGEQLYAISEATNRDGTVDVSLHEYETTSNDGEVRVTFECPDGTIRGELMEWPNSDDEKYKFVRLMNRAGAGLVSVETAFDSNTTVHADPDDWTLVAPAARRKRLTERGTRFVSAVVPENPIKTVFALFWLGLIVCALLLSVGGLILL